MRYAIILYLSVSHNNYFIDVHVYGVKCVCIIIIFYTVHCLLISARSTG